ncbi:MAG: DNA polymerase ligase N-terminal domain-containing protein [bacterium]|nr:DNA polymerase ligase N-terminal domain-containing protein [bacterium]
MHSDNKSLKAYSTRRDFARTPEPKGKKGATGSRRFVIQKHEATHLHYDFRLAIDGVLVSWAVPKGPSLNPSIKRLAVMTEDHPLSYANFEGIIPEGQYGAGTVMVWDSGTYRNIKRKNGKVVSMNECLKNGQIEVFLKGKKLQGGFALIRTKLGWLLIKMRDEYARAKEISISSDNTSAKTGRTMAQIEKDAHHFTK